MNLNLNYSKLDLKEEDYESFENPYLDHHDEISYLSIPPISPAASRL